MSLQFRALDEGLSALGAHMNSGPVSMEVFSHRGIIAEHFRAPLVGTGNGSRYFLAALPLGFDPNETRLSQKRALEKPDVDLPCKLCQLLRIGEIKAGEATRGQLFPRHVFGVVGIRLVRRHHFVEARRITLLLIIFI